MQLVGSIGAEIEIGSYAEVVNAVPVELSCDT